MASLATVLEHSFIIQRLKGEWVMFLSRERMITGTMFFNCLLLAACGGSNGTATPSGGGTNPGTLTVGGTLTGLTPGNSIALTNSSSGTDSKTLTADGAFTFATKLETGAAYTLTLTATTPTVQPCTSTYGSGTIQAANITSLKVFCGPTGGPGTFSSAGSMADSHEPHAATLLQNGDVLVAGGYDAVTIPASTELYSPSSGTWATTGSLATARYGPTATLLPNGKVLHGRKELEACVRSGTSVSSAVIRGIKAQEWVQSDWPETMEAARQDYYGPASKL